VSFRMTERLKDRLRDYAHFSRRQKQDIMDQAVHEFLRREGY
jgi:predicted transcriptional regulator